MNRAYTPVLISQASVFMWGAWRENGLEIMDNTDVRHLNALPTILPPPSEGERAGVGGAQQDWLHFAQRDG